MKPPLGLEVNCALVKQIRKKTGAHGTDSNNFVGGVVVVLGDINDFVGGGSSALASYATMR